MLREGLVADSWARPQLAVPGGVQEWGESGVRVGFS
jgi:hypothetical protein